MHNKYPCMILLQIKAIRPIDKWAADGRPAGEAAEGENRTSGPTQEKQG